MIIYKIANLINGKVYIGQTVRTLEVRTEEHKRHNRILIDKAIQKYGFDNFVVEVIDSATSIDELNQKERYWIAFFNCLAPIGYNQCMGGDNTVGFHHRQESKQKMSIARGKMYIGENNPFYGCKHTETAKTKMSVLRKGMGHLTPEQVKKLRESHRTCKVKNIETGEIFASIKEAAEKHKIESTHITRVCKRKRKTAGGYHWEYVS